jgi:hypothetical protein
LHADFAAGVHLQLGESWMENRVALEVPIRGRRAGAPVRLPVELQKAANDRNEGELAVFVMLSNHLGEAAVVAAVVGAFGSLEALPDGFVCHLSDPSRGPAELRAADEFKLSLNTRRTLPALVESLVAARVIERLRVCGTTQFGEERAAYRVRF